jgi:hypothetical protein
MGYTHVLNRGGLAARSPLDREGTKTLRVSETLRVCRRNASNRAWVTGWVAYFTCSCTVFNSTARCTNTWPSSR